MRQAAPEDAPCPERLRAGSGFTLVEVMAGMLLTGLLVVGLTGLWAMVGEQFFRLTLRQKAIFALHGHMERIAALYRWTGFRGEATLHADLTRIIHRTGINGTELSNVFIPGLVVRRTDATAVLAADFVPGQILFMDLATDDNIIWLDRARAVTARITWALDEARLGCAANGADSRCYRLWLTLDYPFRFQAGTGPAEAMWDRTETLSVQTLVGRR